MARKPRPDIVTEELARIDRRTQIVDEAAFLFARKGFSGTTLKDVADRCDMTKAALYYYFPDKESLVRAVYVTRMAQLNKSMHAALSRAPADPLSRIAAFVRHCASRIDGNREAWIVGSQLFASLETSPGAEVIVALRDEFENTLRTEVERAMDQGVFRRMDVALTARLLLSWVNYIPRWHRQGSGMSAEAVCDVFLDMTLKGLLEPQAAGAGGQAATTGAA
ncbi:hypothetical protein ATO6_12565 [Oceanicola sp. 22II-s10i]|uniref:TetR/AcrR family transcriptional regulator n=1 Tax=Oceanicola sp. 22II-s10i TaxID=1317116 RepID=UPI000B526F91|nr:TetR/AcrR family transcriptional regulator [Oceanicola sp. 22II-s10i]OWU84507.1 hypothetical protein ATO6_12565 [Oceanicola sp. 22II-s10i]